MGNSVILKWREATPDGSVRWFLRGIRSDGSFYGEIQRIWRDERSQTGIEGKLCQRRLTMIRGHVENVRKFASQIPQPEKPEDWTGLLAEGAVQQPEIILRYNTGDEQESPAAKYFLKIIDVLRPHAIEAENMQLNADRNRWKEKAANLQSELDKAPSKIHDLEAEECENYVNSFTG